MEEGGNSQGTWRGGRARGLGWVCFRWAEGWRLLGLSVAARPNCLISICLPPRPVGSLPTGPHSPVSQESLLQRIGGDSDGDHMSITRPGGMAWEPAGLGQARGCGLRPQRPAPSHVGSAVWLPGLDVPCSQVDWHPVAAPGHGLEDSPSRPGPTPPVSCHRGTCPNTWQNPSLQRLGSPGREESNGLRLSGPQAGSKA